MRSFWMPILVGVLGSVAILVLVIFAAWTHSIVWTMITSAIYMSLVFAGVRNEYERESLKTTLIAFFPPSSVELPSDEWWKKGGTAPDFEEEGTL